MAILLPPTLDPFFGIHGSCYQDKPKVGCTKKLTMLFSTGMSGFFREKDRGKARSEKLEARRACGAVSFDTSRRKITQSPADYLLRDYSG